MLFGNRSKDAKCVGKLLVEQMLFRKCLDEFSDIKNLP